MLGDLQTPRRDAGRLFPLSLGAEGSLHRRRQPRDQRRRHRRAALRHDARPHARARGGAARRTGLGRAAAAAQGQHRLRPHPALRRRPRARSGSSPQRRCGCSPRPPAGATAWLALPDVAAAAVAAAAAARAGRRVADGVRAGLAPGAATWCSPTCPAARDPLRRRCTPGTGWSSSPGRRPPTSTPRSRTALVRGLRARPADRRRRRGQPGPARRTVDAARGDLGGAEPEGPSLKHDVTVPIGSLPAFVSATGPRARGRACPGSGW